MNATNEQNDSNYIGTARNFLHMDELSERAKAIVAYAEKNGLYDQMMLCGDTKVISAQYLVQLICNADEVLEKICDSRTAEGSEAYERLLIVAVALTLEGSRSDTWSFGTKLDYELMRRGIRLTKDEAEALYAQYGDYSTNLSKGKLMEKNIVACCVYCGHLLTELYTLKGKEALPVTPVPDSLKASIGECMRMDTPQKATEAFAERFGKRFADPEELDMLMNYLRDFGYYENPASTRYHGAFPGGLAIHNLNVLNWLIDLCNPQDEAEVGKLFLTALCHDLCKLGVYQQGYKAYVFNDPMPLGHGRKSLFMAMRHLSKIPEDVAAAIDGHMRDTKENPDVDRHLAQYPLALILHMADCLATWLDEAE